MTEQFQFQASVKTPKGTLVNVRADDSESFEKNLVAAMGQVDMILTLESSLVTAPGHSAAVANVVNTVGAENVTYISPPQTQVAAVQQPASPSQQIDNWGNTWTYDLPGAPQTPRGPAALKEGKNKQGRAYKGWYDPAKGPRYNGDRNPTDLFGPVFQD